MRPMMSIAFLLAAAAGCFGPNRASASYAIFVGSGLTADGSVLLGGTGDEPSSHWLEIVPRAQHPAGSMVRVGVTQEANFPGELIDIPQVPMTAR